MTPPDACATDTSLHHGHLVSCLLWGQRLWTLHPLCAGGSHVRAVSEERSSPLTKPQQPGAAGQRCAAARVPLHTPLSIIHTPQPPASPASAASSRRTPSSSLLPHTLSQKTRSCRARTHTSVGTHPTGVASPQANTVLGRFPGTKGAERCRLLCHVTPSFA